MKGIVEVIFALLFRYICSIFFEIKAEQMSRLSWISDEDLNQAVEELIVLADAALKKADEKFERNVIDPFAALFEMSGFDLDFPAWIKSEKTRQSQKTLTNHIGDFHQNVLGLVKGWENQKVGNIIDIVSEGKKVIAEIKNKHNTIKKSKEH